MKKSYKFAGSFLSLVLLASCGNNSVSSAQVSSSSSSSSEESTNSVKDFTKAWSKAQKGVTFNETKEILSGDKNQETDYLNRTQSPDYYSLQQFGNKDGGVIGAQSIVYFPMKATLSGVTYDSLAVTPYLDVDGKIGYVVASTDFYSFSTVDLAFGLVTSGDFYVDEMNHTATLFDRYDNASFMLSFDTGANFNSDNCSFEDIVFTYDSSTQSLTGFTTSVIDSYYGYVYNYSVVFASEMEETYQGPDASQLTTKAELDSALQATDEALADSDLTISSTITADTDEPFLKPITSKYIQSQDMIYTSMNQAYWLDAYGYCDLAYSNTAAGWLIATYPENTSYDPVFSSTSVGTSAVGSLANLSSKLFTKSGEENGETYYSVSDSRYFINTNIYKCFAFLGASYYSSFETSNMTALTVGVKNGKVNDFSVTAYAYGIKYVIKYTIKNIGTTYLSDNVSTKIKSSSLFAKGAKWLTTSNFKCTSDDGSYLTVCDNIACIYDSTGAATKYLSLELPASSTNTNKYVFSYTTADSGATWTKKQLNYTAYASLYTYLMNTLYGFPGIDKYNSTAHTVSSDLTNITIGTNYALTYNSKAQVTAMTIGTKSYTFSDYGNIATITIPTVA